MITVLRLNGKNRFSNEFIQMLDPKMKVHIPGHEDIVFRTGHGRLQWRASTALSMEPMLIEWINSFNSDDCFYDIGSNVGTYSIYASRLGIRSYAFEPELNNAQLLYENIFLNRLSDRCMPIPIALGDKTELDVFYLKSFSKGDALHSIGRKSYQIEDPSSATEKLDTLVMKLDDLVRIFGLPNPTKIKIDVDYNELAVLKGAEKTLKHVDGVHIELDLLLDEHREARDFLTRNSFEISNEEKSFSSPTSSENRQFNYLFTKKLS
jgi:FkbM family methyltransferase